MNVQQKTLKNLCLLAAFGLCLGSAHGALAAIDPFASNTTAKVVSTGNNTSPVKFTVGLGAGYLTGEASEIVYWPEQGNHKASELTWKIDSLFMFNINAEMEIKEWIKVKLDTWFKVTDGEGSMDDYDWLIVGGDWTDWSHHEDTDVTDAYIFDLSGELAFFKSDTAVFSAIVGYKVDNFGWEARGGDFIYSEKGYRNFQGSFPDGDLGISYEQTYSSLYLGVGTELTFSNFKTEARIIYAPYVYGEDTDYHHWRNLQINGTVDEFGEGDMIAIDLSGTYSFNDHLSLGIGFRYQKYSTMTGDSEWIDGDEGTFEFYPDSTGMDQTSTMFTTILKYTF